MTAPTAKTNPRKLGVVTVTFNAADFLQPFMDCCLAQTHQDFELLVIDNDSSDNTLEVLSSVKDSRVKLIQNERNIGYAAACNQGVRYFLERGASDVLLINNDTEFSPDLFESLQVLRAGHDADAITPRISHAENTSINWYAGGRFTFWKGFQGEHLGEGRQHDPSDTQPRWTPVAPGCCVMFPCSTFERIGFFDENYFVYFEDTDYFLRMQRAGLRLLYAPGVSIAHKISLSTGGPQSDFSIRYYQRNQIYLLRQHFGLVTVAIQVVLIVLKATFRLLAFRDTFRLYVLRLSSIGEGLVMPGRAASNAGQSSWQ
jgi:GT2 family glycosyltransferase